MENSIIKLSKLSTYGGVKIVLTLMISKNPAIALSIGKNVPASVTVQFLDICFVGLFFVITTRNSDDLSDSFGVVCR